MLTTSQWLAVITGLASGGAELTGLKWLLVISFIAPNTIAVTTTGVGGI